MQEHILANQYREGLRSFGEVMPNVMQAYNQFTNACFEAGELSVKHKHLTALGISLFSGNEHCIVYHMEGALSEGASEQEIAETVAVAGAYGGGTTFSHGVILINEVLQQRQQARQ
ncbi:carboxymuconolactone decarboxylase family protein [Brevibacillus fulvus]|uniref:AhpD family alkylhydroperoxidase n=1 Tax=Brevibacillus fulvus TaxID=1125967 RepID=A0A938XXW1_9BACL|nr:carboxymuconolactone decarboxylase family protein [Brevibacillus fulvus]MBM7588456.1 AhpD family alkylhydroperoxidase [Brevibacillus fulvus]